MQSWLRSPGPILRRNMTCLYMLHLVWRHWSFYIVRGAPFCLSCQSVGSGSPAMPTLELVNSTRVVVRAFAPSAQTLWRVRQVVLPASCLKAKGGVFRPEGFAIQHRLRTTSHRGPYAQRKVPNTESTFLALRQHVGTFTRKHCCCACSTH